MRAALDSLVGLTLAGLSSVDFEPVVASVAAFASVATFDSPVFSRDANASFGGGGGATRALSRVDAGALGTPELIRALSRVDAGALGVPKLIATCFPLSAGLRVGITAPGSVLSFFGIVIGGRFVGARRCEGG